MTKYKKFPGFNHKKEDLCNAMQIPLFVTNIEGKILFANRAFLDLFNIASTEGIYNESVFGKKNSILIFNIYEKLFDKGNKTFRFHHKKNLLEITFHKNSRYILGTIRDVTSEIKNLEIVDNYTLYLNLIKSTISTYFGENKPAAALERILNDIMYYVDLIYTQIFLLTGNQLTLFYKLGDPPVELNEKKVFLVGEDTPGTAYQLKKIVFVKDPLADTRFKNLKTDVLLSLIDIPISYKGKDIGVIEFIANSQLSPATNIIWDFFPQLLMVISDLLNKITISKNSL